MNMKHGMTKNKEGSIPSVFDELFEKIIFLFKFI